MRDQTSSGFAGGLKTAIPACWVRMVKVGVLLLRNRSASPLRTEIGGFVRALTCSEARAPLDHHRPVNVPAHRQSNLHASLYAV
ncbi:MAG TPA: hypothetical protein DCM54_08425 [Gammaproteobacteria bacterium]|nr:hypothetical protein [Gammaproteobacteria bacterium]